MSNLRLFTTSAIVVLVLAGLPHLTACQNAKSSTSSNVEQNVSMSSSPTTNSTSAKTVSTNEVGPKEDKSDSHILEGRWKVSWEGEGAAIYELKMEDDQLIGYSIKLMDTKGEAIPDNTKVFELKSFANSKGKGTYLMEYEGKNYDTPCTLALEGDKLFVTYGYFGTNVTETWVKQ